MEELKITLETISNEKIDFFNISNVIEICKKYIITNLPSLESMEKYKYNNVSNEEIKEKVKKQFGNEIQIKQKI